MDRHRRPSPAGLVSAACGLLATVAASIVVSAGPPAVSADPKADAGTIVAVADVHGDADALVAILRHAGLIDASNRWTGGRSTFVQTGDYLDRGPEVRQVLDLLMGLEQGAHAAGGRAVALLGNHEAMNVIGILRDVSPEAYVTFADSQSEERRESAFDAWTSVAASRRAALAKGGPTVPVPPVYGEITRDDWMASHPAGMLEYLEAFGPEGNYGRWLRRRPVALRVGDTVFMHGGLDPSWAPKKLESVTTTAEREIARWDKMRAYMIDKGIATAAYTSRELIDAGRAELARVAVEARSRSAQETPGLPPEVTRHPLAGLLDLDSWSLVSADGPLWFRGFATWSSDEGRRAIDALQRRYGPVRFVVGHTPLKPPRQMARFGGRVFLIDTGISSVYRAEGGRPSSLEIRDGIYTAVYLDDRTVLFDPMARVVR